MFIMITNNDDYEFVRYSGEFITRVQMGRYRIYRPFDHKDKCNHFIEFFNAPKRFSILIKFTNDQGRNFVGISGGAK